MDSPYLFLPVLSLPKSGHLPLQVSFHASLRREVDRGGLGSALKHKGSVFIQNLRGLSTSVFEPEFPKAKCWVGGLSAHRGYRSLPQ